METKPAINTSERLFDLVRYMRTELHDQGLINDREYAWLAFKSPMATSPKGGSPSRERLEEYDEMRERLAALPSLVAALREISAMLPEKPMLSFTHKIKRIATAALALAAKAQPEGSGE